MSKVTPEMIKTLRTRTGVGMNNCRIALVETDGDIEKAIEYLRKVGISSAAKKESRATHEGCIEFGEDAKGIALVEMNAETDFVVKSEIFKKFQNEVVKEVIKTKPDQLEGFLNQKFSNDPTKTIDEARRQAISILGENINISKILYISKNANTSLGIYLHMNGKVLSLVEITGASDQCDFAKDIAMHIVAEAPDFLREEDVPIDLKAKEEEIAIAQLQEGLNDVVSKKIVQGKIKAFYNQACLLNQKYIKDQSITISDLVKRRSQEIKKDLHISKFIRWCIGSN